MQICWRNARHSEKQIDTGRQMQETRPDGPATKQLTITLQWLMQQTGAGALLPDT